jgi:hypothetical protein|tara:strand:+ start:3633 stop:4232 length:600 start_codon:yes stop_codon:yes gene_type:complete
MTISDLGVLYANKEPTIVYAGTTWRWERSLSSQFPAATWTLDYYFRSSDGKYNFDIQATNNSGNFRVNYTSALSDDVAPTIYMGQGFVSNAANERFIVYEGQLEIMPDFNLQNTGKDLRSHAQKVLEQIKALLEGRFVDDSASYSIAGRSLTKLTPLELIETKHEYERIVIAETRQNRAKQGLETGQVIRANFTGNSGF